MDAYFSPWCSPCSIGLGANHRAGFAFIDVGNQLQVKWWSCNRLHVLFNAVQAWCAQHVATTCEPQTRVFGPSSDTSLVVQISAPAMPSDLLIPLPLAGSKPRQASTADLPGSGGVQVRICADNVCSRQVQATDIITLKHLVWFVHCCSACGRLHCTAPVFLTGFSRFALAACVLLLLLLSTLSASR